MDKAKSSWSADEPAESDPLFKIAVMARIEEYRFRRAVRAWLVRGGALLLVFWWLAPQLERIAADLEPLAYIVILGAAGLCLLRLPRSRRRQVARARR
jgi:hypothetical protein